MATQLMTIATLNGDAAAAIAKLFHGWRFGATPPEPAAVDRFCEAVRAEGASLPFVYFCEWVDSWSMGDLVPGPGAVEGRCCEATCLQPRQAIEWAAQCSHQFDEYQWFATRLREAAALWQPPGETTGIVVIRRVLGPSVSDDEVCASCRVVPKWLKST